MFSESDATKQIVTHLMSIPFFDRLSEAEVEKIYSICRVAKYQADQVIYKFGTPSDGMFILLDGQLVARTKAGMDIAYISPIGLVGEMGVITDEPRSADVVGISDSMRLEITKEALVQLFIEDASICRKILLNLVKNLSNKLYDTNAEIEKLREEQKQAAGQGLPRQTTFSYTDLDGRPDRNDR